MTDPHKVSVEGILAELSDVDGGISCTIGRLRNSLEEFKASLLDYAMDRIQGEKPKMKWMSLFKNQEEYFDDGKVSWNLKAAYEQGLDGSITILKELKGDKQKDI